MNRGLTRSQSKFGFIRKMALALTLGVSSPALTAQTAQTYRQQAAEFARSESWDEAIAAYRKAIELSPNDPAIHYDLALVLQHKGASRQAVEEFETAVRLKPAWAEAHYSLGAAYYELHDLPPALKELRKAEQLDPSNANVHRLLAHLYVDQNDFVSAETELVRTVALKPSAEGYFELGQAQGRLGKLDSAALQYRKALRLDPKLARVHVMLGIVLRRQGNHTAALAEFREAVALDPSDPNAQYNLGMELKTSGDLPGAIAAFQRAIELKPDFEMAHYSLGIALRAQGDTAAAHKELAEINGLHNFRLRLSASKLLIMQGVEALKKNDLDSAMELFQKAVEQTPELPTGYYYLGVTWERNRMQRARSRPTSGLSI